MCDGALGFVLGQISVFYLIIRGKSLDLQKSLPAVLDKMSTCADNVLIRRFTEHDLHKVISTSAHRSFYFKKIITFRFHRANLISLLSRRLLYNEALIFSIVFEKKLESSAKKYYNIAQYR